MSRALEILDPGVQSLLQDPGRLGQLAVGVGRSGAADRAAYRLGARLLGNAEDAAAVEVTLGGLRARARGDLLVCVTGATAPLTVGGHRAAHAAPVHVRDGEEISLGMASAGLRAYLSVRGGLVPEPVLGSCATDTMSGLGPPPLAAGDVVPVGERTRDWPNVDVAPVPAPTGGEVVLVVTPGPRQDWFADPEVLSSTAWVVSDRSDRKGIRLQGNGSRLERTPARQDAELPSEGMVRGAVQVPPDGEPVVFLNDHPVTGGYPVVGVVRGSSMDRAAQLTPGQVVRFRWESLGWRP